MIVIRYDPEVIFLTYDLMVPLVEREVVLRDESSDECVGRLYLGNMKSNALQPKGVFVGTVWITWAEGADVPVERHDQVLTDGLHQLRKALSRRLVTPRHRSLTKRARALEETIDELTVSIDRNLRRLLQSDDAAAARTDLDEATSELEISDLERRSAQQEHLVAMAGMQKSEAALSAARALLRQIRTDAERTKALVESGTVSTLEKHKVERQLASAAAQLEAAEADLLAERVRVEQRTTQADLLERRHERLQDERAAATERIKRLPRVPDDAERLQIELRIELDRGRLAEAGVQLQRTRSALATLTEVSIERW